MTYLHCKEIGPKCTFLHIKFHFGNKPLHRTKITLHRVFVEEKWEERKGILRSNKDRPMVLFTVINPNIKKVLVILWDLPFSLCDSNWLHPSKILHCELLNNGLIAKKEDKLKKLYHIVPNCTFLHIKFNFENVPLHRTKIT
jgi:hypothetical protein